MSAVADITLPPSLPLKNISGTTPPKERLANPSDGRALVATVVQGNSKRTEFYSLCEGQLDGNSPFDPVTLRNHGQQWRTNVNPMDAEAMAESAMTPYYDLFAGGKYYCEVIVNGEPDPDRKWWYGFEATERFNRMLGKWRAFRDEFYSALFDRLYHGKGFLFFSDDDNWRFEYVPQHRVMVPDGTEPDPDKAECIVVRQRLTVTRLWNLIRDRDTATARGWNVEAVSRAMRAAGPDKPTGGQLTGDNYMEAQNWLRDRDISESARSEKVMLAHLFIAEYDGSVSHYIVTEAMTAGEPVEGEWLFKKPSAYQNMRQVIAPMFYETRRNSWNGSAGMAKRTYSSMELSNRFFCSTMDAGFLRAGITLQAKSQRSRQSTALVQVGAFNIIPPEYDVQQATVMGDLQGTMTIGRYLEEKMGSNTGTFRQRMEKPSGNPRTAKEVELQYQTAAILGNSSVNRFYDDVDPLYAEIYRRATDPNTTDKDAKEFQKACADAGIPKELLRKGVEVRAYRQMGNGSSFLRQQSIANSLAFVPLLPEAGKQNWLDDAISVTASHDTVTRWNPRAAVPQSVERDTWDSKVENDVIKDGAPVQWTSVQNNIVHSQEHLLAGSQAAQALQQGANPVQILAFLQGILEHTAEHLAALASDKFRRDETAMLQKQFQALAKIATELQSQTEQAAQQQAEAGAKMQQAQAIQQGTDPDTAIKAAETQKKMELQEAKTRQQMALKSAKARQDMAIADLRTAQQVKSNATKNQP